MASDNDFRRYLLFCCNYCALEGFDARYARASYVQSVAERLDNKIIQDKMDNLQERMWKLEDRWTNIFWEKHLRLPESLEELLASMSEDARENYRALKAEYDKLEKQLEKKTEE